MNIGTATAIFCRINDSDISYKDKIAAIGEVLDMPTHNGITKAQILEALRWLYSTALPGNNLR